MLDLVIKSIEKVTERIRYFAFSSANGAPLPAYSAGAHLEFQLGEAGIRAYSLIDFVPPPTPPVHYHIAVQYEENGGGGSRHMHELCVGDTVLARQPRNSFALTDSDLHCNPVSDTPVLLLAGGIGITPLVSMATALQQNNVGFHLYYSGRTPGSMAFAETLKQQLGKRLTLQHDDDESSRLDLSTLLGDLQTSQSIYVCGPKGMIDAVKSIAGKAGVSSEHIHVELFESTASTDSDIAFEIELQGTGQVFVIPPGQTIIEVLEAAGIDLVYDCQRGDCGICQTAVIAGEIDHRDVVLSDAERSSGDVMQICVSRAKSARLVLDLP